MTKESLDFIEPKLITISSFNVSQLHGNKYWGTDSTFL